MVELTQVMLFRTETVSKSQDELNTDFQIHDALSQIVQNESSQCDHVLIE